MLILVMKGSVLEDRLLPLYSFVLTKHEQKLMKLAPLSSTAKKSADQWKMLSKISVFFLAQMCHHGLTSDRVPVKPKTTEQKHREQKYFKHDYDSCILFCYHYCHFFIPPGKKKN